MNPPRMKIPAGFLHMHGAWFDKLTMRERGWLQS